MVRSKADLFELFANDYENGSYNVALQRIITSPQNSYDLLHSQEKNLLPLLINFADASVFKGALEYRQTLQILTAGISQDSRLQMLCFSFLEALEQEYALFYWWSLASEKDVIDSVEIPDKFKKFFLNIRNGAYDQLDSFLPVLPERFQTLFCTKIKVLQGWDLLQQTRPSYAEWLGGAAWQMHAPWHPFTYELAAQPQSLNSKGQIPLLFLEPLAEEIIEDFLNRWSQKECIWVVETVAHFFQLLQSGIVQDYLQKPWVRLYILNRYPQNQFALQKYLWSSPYTLQPVWMSSRTDLIEWMPLLIDAIQKCLQQPAGAWDGDSPAANELYAIGKNFVFKREAERYGPSRFMALNSSKSLNDWFDPHKGLPPPHADIGPPAPDYLAEILKEALKGRKPKASPKKKKKARLAHVVPQIVDGGHAPTRLLKGLCSFADRHRYEIFVLSTERLTEHLMDYPIASYVSDPSQVRGKEAIKFLEKTGVELCLDPDSPSLLSAAQFAKSKLEEWNIDIAVFHGPDAINEWCASASSVPLRVFFEHGTVPEHACFDTLILSTEQAYEQHKERFEAMGMEANVLLFSVDVREGWKKQPFPRSELGLPQDCFAMTTISNHLDSRLGGEMCKAVGEILQRCSNAVYAPIGQVRDPARLRALFDPYGVNDRIFFLGYRDNPSQVARSMHLFLNEFPFGSCIGMLDAMAAGCPVVSMDDAHGPPQARYGAALFGADYVITSGRREDYVDLACRLIEDQHLYRVWSQHAVDEYEKRVDVKKYVESFEKIIEKARGQ